MDDEVRLAIGCDDDVVTARQKGRSMAIGIGLSKTEATLVATAISEVARNIVQYVGAGEIILRTVTLNGRAGVSVLARDQGPGIQSIEAALGSEHSTGGRTALGLPGTRRLMDDFEICSRPGIGTSITMTKWRNRSDVH
jgi:serine/threonine-protein kinase RsbT